MSGFREALLEVSEIDLDSKIRSEARSLATNELGDFEFLMSIIIWFEILYEINLVSKLLQSKNMLIDVAMEKIKGLISFFERYRESRFDKTLDNAKEISIEMNIDPVFPQRRIIRRKRQFDENLITPSVELSEEESFRLQSLDDATLESCCNHFEHALKHNDRFDIDGRELCVELKLLRNILPEEITGPIDILKYLKGMDYFSNTIIAYRILLTIPVTVASTERSFSKLKLLKSYLRSTMLQERLNGLALIAIENDILETIQYEDLVDDFASKSVRRIALFK
ncbi:uncharacterized protein LOC131658207 [Vicia villosa]|uniref:uncharacterized protein LOC131658207 n=1 Tax=Vicia villosa TaxID=3911 RepID=UPI00273C0EEB|nr:uncharacterized protein LOC131658207 [Vicia villosa]